MRKKYREALQRFRKRIPAGRRTGKFADYPTAKLAKMTGTLALETVRSFWRKHVLASRLIALFLVLLLLFSILQAVYIPKQSEEPYSLSPEVQGILGTSVDAYASALKLDPQTGVIEFNKDYKPSSDIGGDSAVPKVTASFSPAPKNEVTIQDPFNQVSVSFVPKFTTKDPRKDGARVVYPIDDSGAKSVYTMQGSGIKQDIILEEYQGDSYELTYEVVLAGGLEMRSESDGSIGVYGIDSPLLGNVTTATEQDAELLETARKNGDKTKLLFTIPAPFIVEPDGQTTARSWFSINGNELTIHASGLEGASYPLSIDPTIYVDTAKKFMRGNNETNVDFDTTNELIKKSDTSGARIDFWSDSTEMAAGVWDQAMANAGGYVYRAGGRADPTMPYIASQQATSLGTAGTSFTMAMPTIRPANDLYVAIISRPGTGTITPPVGGNWLLYSTGTNTTTATQNVTIYYKIGQNISGGDEAASYAWTNSASVQWTGTILRIKGFDAANPRSANPAVTTGTSTATSPPIFPAITVGAQDATLVLRAVGISEDDPSEATWLPLGHTRLHSSTSVANTAASTALVATYLDVPPVASGTAAAATLAQDGILVDAYGAVSFAIRPASVTAGVQRTVEWAQFDTNSRAISSPNPGNGVCSDWCSNTAYQLPAARVGMSMAVYNGYLYALGGSSDGTVGNNASTVWVAKLGINGEPQLWHPTGGTPDYWFVSANTLPSARVYTTLTAYNNRLYLAGGRDSSGNSISTVHVTDILPTGDITAWTTSGMQSLPDARHSHSVLIYNDYMYVIGGITTTGGGSTNTFRNTVFYSKLNTDGTMNTWTSTSGFTTARGSLGGQMVAVRSGYIYLGGGCTAVTVSGSNLYCNTIASDVQLVSINADGTLAPWNTVLNLSNQRFAYSLLSWQGGLYRFGGCNRQNTSTGVCQATHRSTEFGVVNPSGDASTVSNSEPSGTSPCSGGAPINCDLPPAGDGAGQGGQMSSMTVINNGFIYVIGGCTSISQTDECTAGGAVSAASGNVSYAALNSVGQMVAPASCISPNTSSGLWCVDNTNRVNGTAGVAAGSATVFNNTIYVIGGTDGVNWQANVWSVLLNVDGSLSGAWATQTFTNLALGTARGYSYAFTRSNPSSATYPGNLYVLGGCNGGVTADGLGCNTYFSEVYKCNILANGTLEEADANDCDTANQLQIDADTSAGGTGTQGIGLMSGTVYANRVYLIGGACPAVGTLGPCRAAFAPNREDIMFARIDNSNNIVDNSTGSSTGAWTFTTAKMDPTRRRAVAFGYNGYIYSLAGYTNVTTSSLQDLLFAKVNVTSGDVAGSVSAPTKFDSSGVVVTPRWDLRAIASNGYVYAIGGCGTGAAPDGCTAMQPEIQTFQLYNNDSGTPISYAPSTNQFANDRFGGSSAIVDGYLYVAGGCLTIACTTAGVGITDSVQYAAIDVYGNLSTVWLAGNALPAARSWGQLEVLGSTLYYIGGQNDSGVAQANVYYSSSITSGNPTWASVAGANELPAARTQFGATSWDGRIYVTGGLDGSGTRQTTIYVSPRLISGGIISTPWTTNTTSMPIALNGHTTIAYANNIYIIGGESANGFVSSVEVAPIGYKVGSITQSGTAVTGSGTAWTGISSGTPIQFNDGTIGTINSVNSDTSITASIGRTAGSAEPYLIQDGRVGSWTYTTSLPEPIAQADGFAANGYMYLVGGRSSLGDCVPNTLLAPISANTFTKNSTVAAGLNNPTGVGEWYETNQRYTGERYGNAVAYSNGKMYLTGGGCEKWPTVASISTQQFNTDTTAHNVTMPATVDAGDLLIVLFSNDGNATVTDPDVAGPWTQISTQTRGTNVRGSVWAKDANGTEDATNVNFVTSATEQATAQVYRIPAANWEGNIASVTAANVDPGGTSNAPDPPNLDPAGWGTENTLWINYVAGSEYASVTTYPANNTNGTHVTSTGGAAADRASTSSSRRENRVAAEDPGVYAMPSTSNGVSFTIAVRPSAFVLTGANRTVQTGLYSQPQVASYSRMIDTDTDVFPVSWLLNGEDGSIGARWNVSYRSMHDINPTLGGSDSVLTTPPSTFTLQQNPNEDCGTASTMPVMTTWGQNTPFGATTLQRVEAYTAKNSSGGNINCARYYYFYATIDASQTFGYPEDINRGPTITDLSLFFTSDPSKRLRHGKTFTGGEQQPLDAQCRVSGANPSGSQPNCPLP
jgi:N-acetylneuraminic acid mutarotase